MHPADRDPAFIWDMLNAAREINHFLQDVKLADYQLNRLLQMGVERLFTIIGEAARHVSTETRAMCPDVPWRSIVGKRNIIIHVYYEIDNDRVYLAAVDDIPGLITRLEVLLNQLA